MDLELIKLRKCRRDNFCKVCKFRKPKRVGDEVLYDCNRLVREGANFIENDLIASQCRPTPSGGCKYFAPNQK